MNFPNGVISILLNQNFVFWQEINKLLKMKVI